MKSWHRTQNGPVAFLALARPPINALDRAALRELAGAIEEIEADAATRVLVITGGLQNLFCSGGDLKYWRRISDPHAVSREGSEAFEQIRRLGIPTVAAINGHVVGDGLTLALACDLRVAAEHTTFRLPETAYGFIPGWGLVRQLVACVGEARAADLLLTGRRFDAARAERIGLVHDMVPSERLMNHVIDLSRKLAARSPRALAAAKCALHGEDESGCFAQVWGGVEWREGVDALLAKRMPTFVSRGGGNHDLPGTVQSDRVADRRSACC